MLLLETYFVTFQFNSWLFPGPFPVRPCPVNGEPKHCVLPKASVPSVRLGELLFVTDDVTTPSHRNVTWKDQFWRPAHHPLPYRVRQILTPCDNLDLASFLTSHPPRWPKAAGWRITAPCTSPAGVTTGTATRCCAPLPARDRKSPIQCQPLSQQCPDLPVRRAALLAYFIPGI